MKWILVIGAIAIGYMVSTGDMGGSNKATGNYMQVMHGGASK